MLVADGWIRNINLAIRCSAVVACFYITYLGVDSLAGKTTVAQFVAKVVADLRANEGFAAILGLGGAAWGYRERKLRQRRVASLSDQNRRLQEILDGQRTSSTLLTDGTTRPEDKQ